jgi:Domain of unknown function (DUF4288)
VSAPRLFVAVLVLESRVGTRDDSPIVDHQIRIIEAPTAASAHARALRLGEGENSTYRNRDGETIRWRFLGVSALAPLDRAQVRDGGELFSWRTLGPGWQFVRAKAQLAAFARGAGGAQRGK